MTVVPAPSPWWRRHPGVVDVAVALVATTAAVVGAPPSPGEMGLLPSPLTTAGLLLLGAGGASLLWRRRAPVVVWCVTAAVSALSGPLLDEPGRGLPLAAAALYAVSRYAGRRAALLTTGATAAAAVLGLAGADDLGFDVGPRAYAAFAFCGLAAALGDAVRTNRLLLDDAVRRAEEAERTREREAQRAVVEERLRVSRELHDVVGHHLAVVNVQAGAAEHLWDSDPDAAREAVSRVRAEAVTALRQTGRLVDLLRAEDGATDADPSVAALAALVDGVRTEQRPVRWTHRGEALDPLWECSPHVYRLIQEALTNAVRHGDGAVELLTDNRRTELAVQVRNRLGDRATDAGAPASGAGRLGHGLVVMRERISLCHGTLRVGEQDGWFVVDATVPLEPTGDAVTSPAARRGDEP